MKSIFELHQRHRQALLRIRKSNSVLLQCLICTERAEEALSLPRAAVIDSHLEEIVSLLSTRLPRALRFGVLPDLPLRLEAALAAGADRVHLHEEQIEPLLAACNFYLLSLALLAGDSEEAGRRIARIKTAGIRPGPGETMLPESPGAQILEEIALSLGMGVAREAEFALRLAGQWRSFQNRVGACPIVPFLERAADDRRILPWAYFERISFTAENAPGAAAGRTLILNMPQAGAEFTAQCSTAVELAGLLAARLFQLAPRRHPHLFHLTSGYTPLEQTGSSAGLGLALSALSAVTRSCAGGPEIDFAQDCAFSGSIKSDGNVQEVSEPGLVFKIRAALASPITKLVVPRGNAEACRRELERRGSGGGALEIIPVSSLEEVLCLPSVVRIRRPRISLDANREAREQGSRPFLVTVLVCVLIIINLLLPTHQKIRNLEIDHGYLMARGQDGGRLWRESLALYALGGQEWQLDSTLEEDIDGDHRPELFAVLRTEAADEERQRSYLFMCSAEGGIHWHRQIGSLRKLGSQIYAPDYRVTALLAFERDGRRRIVAVANHRTSFLCAVTAFSLDGRKRGSYMHIGRLGEVPEQVLIHDMDRDGRAELVLAGTNASFREGVIVALDPLDLWGTGPYRRDEKLHSIPEERGGERCYIRIRPSILALAGEGENSVHSISLVDGRLVAETVENRAVGARCCLSLSPFFPPTRTAVSDDYKKLLDSYVASGRVITADEEWKGGWALYWDGEGWQRLPTRNSAGRPLRRVDRSDSGVLAAVIDVPANECWFDSGLDVPPGSHVYIRAEGRALALGDGFAALSPSGSGARGEVCGFRGAVGSLSVAALIAKIGAEGEAFQVGGEYRCESAPGGRLLLANNLEERRLRSASGFWRARVFVTPPGVPVIEDFRVDLKRGGPDLQLVWAVRGARLIALFNGIAFRRIPAGGAMDLGRSRNAAVYTLVASNGGRASRSSLGIPAESGPPEIQDFSASCREVAAGDFGAVGYRTGGALLVRLQGADGNLPPAGGCVPVETEATRSECLEAFNRQGKSVKTTLVTVLPGGSTTIQVPANRLWHNTGVRIAGGRVVEITAEGLVRPAEGVQVTPAGLADPAPPATENSDPDYSAPGLPRYALVGRVGPAGRPFLVGGRYVGSPVPRGSPYDGGILYLSVNAPLINDGVRGDSGSWKVVVRR